MKGSQHNIYEEAAYLVSHLVHPRNKSHKKGVLVYLCKPCGTNVAPRVKKNVKSRLKLITHLALVYPAEYQALADQLEVTPGPKLNDLLFEGLASELIFKAMSRT